MEREPKLETAPKEFRLVRRLGAATDEVHFQNKEEVEQFLSESDESSDDDDVAWTGSKDELLAGGLWEKEEIVPNDDDMYELQEKDGDDWQFVGLFKNEEQMEETLREMSGPPKTEDGETIH